MSVLKRIHEEQRGHDLLEIFVGLLQIVWLLVQRARRQEAQRQPPQPPQRR